MSRILNILKGDIPALRRKSKEVVNLKDPQLEELILDMVKTMRKNKGIGLAAPQVGKNVRVLTAEVDDKLFVLINPEIKKLSGKEIIMEEGCLSFPGEFYPIKRKEKVKVIGFNEKGKKVKIKAKEMLARVLQHEIDHLDGVLFIDKVKNE